MTSSAVPTTATVVDFICLFTHDLKRKQKRWQDGVLKYHTFNKRVMVYDDRSHFIGDAHWQGGGDLEPGDEFELDRGSAIVQVSDCTGSREQDLTELLDKRAKEVEKRRTNVGTRTPGPSAAVTHTPVAHTPRNDQNAQNAPHFQLRHRPLTDLVGGSSRIGRAAISPHSPYEVRKMALSPGQQQDSPLEDARPSKRQRREESPPSKMGHARSLFGTALTLTPFSSSLPAARSQALQDRSTMPKTTSTGTRAGPSGAADRADRSSKSPPPSSNPEEVETNAPRQVPPRRTLPQRASLRELLAGNEHNRNGEPPRPREAVPKNRATVAKPLRHRSPPTEDNVVSLLTQEPEPPNHRGDGTLKSSRAAQRNKKSDAEQPLRPRSLANKRAEASNSDQLQPQSAEADQEAFLEWLAQSEGVPSSHQIPVPEPRPRTSRSKKSTKDVIRPIQKPAQEVAEEVMQGPIQIDDDEEARPLPKTTRTRPQSTNLKPSRKEQTARKEQTNTSSELHGTKRTLSADIAAVSHTDADKPPPSKGPRTELRIRSRQRRGLLMMAKNKQGGQSTGRSTPSSSGAGSDVHSRPQAGVRSLLASEEPEVVDSGAADLTLPEKADERRDSVSSKESPIPVPDPEVQQVENLDLNVPEENMRSGSKPPKQPEDEGPQNDDVASVNSIPEEEPSTAPPRRRTNPSRRSRQKPAKAVLSDDQEETMAADSPSKSDDAKIDSSDDSEPDRKPEPKPSSGPRITRMSRKSVKSREIIGFVMPNDDFPTAGFTTGHFGQAGAEKPGDVDTTAGSLADGAQDSAKQSRDVTPVVQQPEAAQQSGRPSRNGTPVVQQPEVAQQSGSENKSQDKQPLRIVNPATRGRKAARRQDAAGLPPQTMVQLEPAAPSRIAPKAPKPLPPGDNAIQSALPSFARANGGPWSRHAEDLLGMTRPSKETSRR
ncbi:hypothetical protein FSARC_12423 [Fusarium sarcochroum]|uniref:5'-3' DNA helicase ZGRF1-like N-terminal domain-containing protein n=1 Tax=Fusarium sarcochroum TaxID=1208366 RepID=A0A8H4WWW3_9HYPO|nr:hypothetical protein FSARC_12423 [Fusarium sarcochroum]